jgi:hypothetical protein
MNDTERRCYRYTRLMLETFEQAHQVRARGWIDDETWAKWRGWIEIWTDSTYFPFVYEDAKGRLIASFTDEIERARSMSSR